MSTTDHNQDAVLSAFFEAGEAPAMDLRFRLGVMERVARRRFLVSLTVRLAGVAVLAALAAPLVPVSGHLLGVVSPELAVLAVVACLTGLAAIAAQAWLDGRIHLPRLRLF